MAALRAAKALEQQQDAERRAYPFADGIEVTEEEEAAWQRVAARQI